VISLQSVVRSPKGSYISEINLKHSIL
jgi:hypothetical protein